jgi:MoxR-like ATPase
VIIGQEDIIKQVFVCLLCRGHALLVGVPGLAKTLLIHTLADAVELQFNRIQFTPDLMPSDITGTEIIEEDAHTGRRVFKFVKGPVFANVILADEINRTPPKTQAALLEAMQEHHVTAAGQTYILEEPFFVLATQNPIEQEGTYPLPEAQLDRFLLHVQVGYPSVEDERRILVLNREEAKIGERNAFRPRQQLPQAAIREARRAILDLHLADELEQYIVNIVVATRTPGAVDASLAGQVMYGASPRAGMGIDRSARAHAWLAGRDYVGPEDIQAVAADVLRHRLVLSFEAEADGVTPDSIIERVLDGVGVP